jgi:hypothetical protein
MTPVTATLPRTQHQLAALLTSGFDALDARLARAVDDATGARFTTLRADGGWSVAQVLEHLCRANEAYLRTMRPLVTTAASARVTGDTPWRPTFLGKQLARSLERTMRLPAPGRSRPGPTPGPDVFRQLLASRVELRALLDAAAGLEWQQLRMASPLAKWVKLNFGDAAYVMLRHGERHAGQIERTLASLPRS